MFVIHKAMPMLALLVSLGKPFLEAPLWKVSNVASGGGVAPAKSYEINRLYCKTQGMWSKESILGVAQTFALSLYRSDIVKGIVGVCNSQFFPFFVRCDDLRLQNPHERSS